MNNKIEVTALCDYVGEVQEFSSGFKKRVFALKEGHEGNKYPTLLAFTLKKDNVDLVKTSDENKVLKVVGYVESRDWVDPKTGNVKFFSEVTAVKVEVQGRNVPPPADPNEEFVDDMPF